MVKYLNVRAKNVIFFLDEIWNFGIVCLNTVVKKQYYEWREKQRILEKVTSAFLPFLFLVIIFVFGVIILVGLVLNSQPLQVLEHPIRSEFELTEVSKTTANPNVSGNESIFVMIFQLKKLTS